MIPDLPEAVRAFPDVAPVAALLAVVNLVDVALRAAHPALLRDEPLQATSQRRALALLRSLHRVRRDATRHLEFHAHLVGPLGSHADLRQLDLF